MKKYGIRYAIVLAIIIALYNVLVFVIPFPKNDIGTFVVVYVASMVAILGQFFPLWSHSQSPAVSFYLNSIASCRNLLTLLTT